MFTKLYERWPGKGEPVEVELDISADIEGVRWIGRVDRLERGAEGLRVVDYKTSTTAASKADAGASVQLAFYALAVEESRGPVVASEMWFPRDRGKTTAVRSVALHDLPALTEHMADITRSIRSEDWEPRVGKQCARCAFRKSCPAWPEGRGAYLT